MKRLLAVLFAVALLVTSVTPVQAGRNSCHRKPTTVIVYRDGKATRVAGSVWVCTWVGKPR